MADPCGPVDAAKWESSEMADLTAQEIKIIETLEQAMAAGRTQTTSHWRKLETACNDMRQAMIEGDAMLKAMVPYFAPPHPRPKTEFSGDIE